MNSRDEVHVVSRKDDKEHELKDSAEHGYHARFDRQGYNLPNR